MKRILLFLFLLASINSQSQNWALVNTYSKYNYKLDTAGYITHTIWVDSISPILSIDMYSLNTIVKRNNACDSLIELFETQGSLGDYCNLCKAWKNQPQFLQKNVSVHPGGIYNFNDPLDFTINSLGNQGESWLFNTTDSATVLNETTSVFSGIIDSVKTILLSTGDTIIISKEHGILVFPDFENAGTYYRLAGPENPDLGETVPGFFQMYNYEVDGVICLSSYLLTFDGQGNTTKKSIITSKEVIADTIKYGTIFHSHLFADGLGWYEVDSASGNENWTFVNSTNALFATFNNQLCSMGNDRYYFSKLYKSDGKYVKKIGVTHNPGSGIYYIESDSIEDLLIPACDLEFESFFYQEGIGLQYYESSCNFECGSTKNYDYLPQNSSNLNYCLSDFTSIHEAEESLFAIFPNPAKGKIELQFEQDFSGALFILNQTGQAVFTSSVQNQRKIVLDISQFAAGVYSIELRNNSHASFQKLIISE